MKKAFTLTVCLLFLCACIGGDKEGGQTNTGEGPQESSNQQQGDSQADSSRDTQDDDEQGLINDLAEAVSSGLGYACTYKVNGGQVVTYVKGESYKTTVDAEGVMMTTISDGEKVYTWQEGQSQGYLINYDDVEEMQPEDDQPNYADMKEMSDAALNVECRRKMISESQFNPPADINFVDLGQQILAMQEMADSGQMGDVCAMCETIPDAQARESCLESC